MSNSLKSQQAQALQKFKLEMDYYIEHLIWAVRNEKEVSLDRYRRKLEEFILETIVPDAFEQGARGAYEIFLTEIKNAKNHFPGRDEFRMEVDMRDIEKTLKALSSPDRSSEE